MGKNRGSVADQTGGARQLRLSEGQSSSLFSSSSLLFLFWPCVLATSSADTTPAVRERSSQPIRAQTGSPTFIMILILSREKREKNENEKTRWSQTSTTRGSAHLVAWPRAQAPALVTDLCVVFVLTLLVILVVVASSKPRPLLAVVCKQPEAVVHSAVT